MFGRESRYSAWALAAVLQAVTLVGAAARHPVTAPSTASPADRTIRGTVRSPEGMGVFDGRTVTVVNLATGEVRETVTNSRGRFSVSVTPGRYRVAVSLRDGELVVGHPDVIDADRSDAGESAEFVIAPSHIVRPRFRAPRGDDGLGAGVA